MPQFITTTFCQVLLYCNLSIQYQCPLIISHHFQLLPSQILPSLCSDQERNSDRLLEEGGASPPWLARRLMEAPPCRLTQVSTLPSTPGSVKRSPRTTFAELRSSLDPVRISKTKTALLVASPSIIHSQSKVGEGEAGTRRDRPTVLVILLLLLLLLLVLFSSLTRTRRNSCKPERGM